MCWFTRDIEYATRRVAYKDIDVFKICYHYTGDEPDTYMSPFYNYRYVVGGIYKEELGRPIIVFNEHVNNYVINQGLHSYDSSKVEITKNGCDSIQVILEDRFGGCYKTSPIRTVVKLNCIIPKGSYYHVNKQGEYVSSSLTVKSVSYVLN